MKRTTRRPDMELESPESKWARVISNLLSPPVVWALLAFPMAYQEADTSGHAILWAMLYGLLVCWMPVLYIAWNVRNGNITDLHMQVRRERIRPFIVTLLCTALAFAVLVAIGAPRLMPMFALFTLIQLALMTLITFVWQISMHAMSITGAVIATGALYGAPIALVMSPLVLVVGAARYKLRRHTLAQLVAGGAVGACMTALLFLTV